MSTDISPTARALRALEILQAHPGVTAAELADRLSVTERAARRYVAILREAGIYVESSRGRYGGYRLGRGTRLAPVSFTEAEALALVMAVLDGHPPASGDLVDTGLSKVIRALPDAVGRQAATVREHALTTPDRSPGRPGPKITSALVAAVAARRRLRVRYRSEAGNEWEAEVDPWAVVVRHGRWYLLCHSHRAEAIRTYRVDRVQAVTETGHESRVPEDLDPVATLEENLGIGWEYPTHVEFEAPLDEVMPWIRPPMGRLHPAGDGCVLVGSTSNPDMYAQEWLTRLPFAFQVRGGQELRASVATLASRLNASVGDDSPGAPAVLARPASD